MSNYIELALRTESVEGAEDRLKNISGSLVDLIAIAKTLENKIDNIKKYIYYGKESNTSDVYLRYHKAKVINTTEDNIRLLHAALGMLTESAEFALPIVNNIAKGTSLDKVNLKEELGDLLWYEAIACDALGTTFKDEQERNIAKLTLRYPEKFTTDKAINRNTKAERKVLEDGKERGN